MRCVFRVSDEDVGRAAPGVAFVPLVPALLREAPAAEDVGVQPREPEDAIQFTIEKTDTATKIAFEANVHAVEGNNELRDAAVDGLTARAEEVLVEMHSRVFGSDPSLAELLAEAEAQADVEEMEVEGADPELALYGRLFLVEGARIPLPVQRAMQLERAEVASLIAEESAPSDEDELPVRLSDADFERLRLSCTDKVGAYKYKYAASPPAHLLGFYTSKDARFVDYFESLGVVFDSSNMDVAKDAIEVNATDSAPIVSLKLNLNAISHLYSKMTAMIGRVKDYVEKQDQVELIQALINAHADEITGLRSAVAANDEEEDASWLEKASEATYTNFEEDALEALKIASSTNSTADGMLNGSQEPNWGGKKVEAQRKGDGEEEALVEECNVLFYLKFPYSDSTKRLNRMKKWYAAYSKLSIMRRQRAEEPARREQKKRELNRSARKIAAVNASWQKEQKRLNDSMNSVRAEYDEACNESALAYAGPAADRAGRSRMTPEKQQARKKVARCNELRAQLLSERQALARVEEVIRKNQEAIDRLRAAEAALIVDYPAQIDRLQPAAGAAAPAGDADEADADEADAAVTEDMLFDEADAAVTEDMLFDEADAAVTEDMRFDNANEAGAGAQAKKGSNRVTDAHRRRAKARKEEMQSRLLLQMQSGVDKEQAVRDMNCDGPLNKVKAFLAERAQVTSEKAEATKERNAWINEQIEQWHKGYKILSAKYEEYSQYADGGVTAGQQEKTSVQKELDEANTRLRYAQHYQSEAEAALRSAQYDLKLANLKVDSYMRIVEVAKNAADIEQELEQPTIGKDKKSKLEQEVQRLTLRAMAMARELSDDDDLSKMGAAIEDQTSKVQNVKEAKEELERLTATCVSLREKAEAAYRALFEFIVAELRPGDRAMAAMTGATAAAKQKSDARIAELNLLLSKKGMRSPPPAEYAGNESAVALLSKPQQLASRQGQINRNIVDNLRKVADNCNEKEINELEALIKSQMTPTEAMTKAIKSTRFESIKVETPGQARSFVPENSAEVKKAVEIEGAFQVMSDHVDEVVYLAKTGSPRAAHYYRLLCEILTDVEKSQQCDSDAALPMQVMFGAMQSDHTGSFEACVSLLTKWASLPLEQRGGAWPSYLMRSDLVNTADLDAHHGEPVLDEQTGEVMLVTKRDMLAIEDGDDAVKYDLLGRVRAYPTSCVPWVKINEATYLPMDEKMFVIRRKPGNTKWQLHRTFGDLVEEHILGNSTGKVPSVGNESAEAYNVVAGYTLWRPERALAGFSPREVEDDDLFCGDNDGWVAAAEMKAKQDHELRYKDSIIANRIAKLDAYIKAAQESSTSTVNMEVQADIASMQKLAENLRIEISTLRSKIKGLRQKPSGGVNQRIQRFRQKAVSVMTEPVWSSGKRPPDYLDNLEWLQNDEWAAKATTAITEWMREYYGWLAPPQSPQDLEPTVLPWLQSLKRAGWPYPRLVAPDFALAEAELAYGSFGPPPPGAFPPNQAWVDGHPTWRYMPGLSSTANQLDLHTMPRAFLTPPTLQQRQTPSFGSKKRPVLVADIHELNAGSGGRPGHSAALQRARSQFDKEMKDVPDPNEETREDHKRRRLAGLASAMMRRGGEFPDPANGAHVRAVVGSPQGALVVSTTASQANREELGALIRAIERAQDGINTGVDIRVAYGSAVRRVSSDFTGEDMPLDDSDLAREAEGIRASLGVPLQSYDAMDADPFFGSDASDKRDSSKEDGGVMDVSAELAELSWTGLGDLRAPRQPCGAAIRPRALQPLPVFVC